MINLTGKNVRNADAVDSLTAHAGYKYAILVENLKNRMIRRNIELLPGAGDFDPKWSIARAGAPNRKCFPM